MIELYKMIQYITPYKDSDPRPQTSSRAPFLIFTVSAGILLAGITFGGFAYFNTHPKITVKANTGSAKSLTVPLAEVRTTQKSTTLSWPLPQKKGYVSSIVLLNDEHFPKNQTDGVVIGNSSNGTLVLQKPLHGYVSIFNFYDDDKVLLAARLDANSDQK